MEQFPESSELFLPLVQVYAALQFGETGQHRIQFEQAAHELDLIQRGLEKERAELFQPVRGQVATTVEVGFALTIGTGERGDILVTSSRESQCLILAGSIARIFSTNVNLRAWSTQSWFSFREKSERPPCRSASSLKSLRIPTAAA